MRDQFVGILLIVCFFVALAWAATQKKPDTVLTRQASDGSYSEPGPTFIDTSKPDLWRMIENHCVAVFTEAHIEKTPSIGFNDHVPEMDGEGNYITRVPEQTLKLRCK